VVADCIADYQESNPQLADRFEEFDLFVERFPLSCLNRLQLRDNRQMVDLDDPRAHSSSPGRWRTRSPGTGDTRLSGRRARATGGADTWLNGRSST